MDRMHNTLSRTFIRFFDSEKASGVVLIFCTLLSVVIANSAIGAGYSGFWHSSVAGLTIEQWINDALMAIFFLLIGLELERELYVGELSNIRNAMLPAIAAIGGMVVPVLLHLSFNHGTATQDGMGIPMATDIAFALGTLAILGSRVPASLKVLVVAFAVIDDLGAIIVIAAFYTAHLSIWYLAGACFVWTLLLTLNRVFRIMSLIPYVLGGVIMWVLMLKSGVHATIAGVMLAFAIPFSAKDDDQRSPSHRLEHMLHKPVAFLILPLFALANTGVLIHANWLQNMVQPNSLGILAGLVVGKPLGVTLFSLVAVMLGMCRLPSDLRWLHILGAGILGGIGFTMSIFITNLAFAGDAENINASKMAILFASLSAGVIGFLWLRWCGKMTLVAQLLAAEE